MTGLLSDQDIVIKRADKLYTKYEFNGRSNYNLGGYANYLYKNFNMFSEFAISKSGGTAFIGGVMGSLSQTVDLALLYRNYQRNYHAFFSNAFGENSRNINEKGLYTGLKVKLHRKLVFSAFADYYIFPWLTFYTDIPNASGQEYSTFLNYSPTKTIKITAQYRFETKDRNFADPESRLKKIEPLDKNYYILNMDYKLNTNFNFKSRVQYNVSEQAGIKSSGFALVQDFGYDYQKLTINARFALFDTDNSSSRIYLFEKDVLYAFSIPSVAGQGLRNYFIVKYSVMKNLDVWIKYSKTSYQEGFANGSGLEAIDGPNRSEFKIQLRYIL